jgi:hypothetical protein
VTLEHLVPVDGQSWNAFGESGVNYVANKLRWQILNHSNIPAKAIKLNIDWLLNGRAEKEIFGLSPVKASIQ